MEIEVGEYVRLARRQGINKIIEIDEDYYLLDCEIADEWGDITDFIKEEKLQEEILNHSKKIIDLIVVGDYVNGHKVVNEQWGEDDNNLYFEIEGGFNKAQYIGEKDIKTILTHEQFEQNAYRLEEK